MNGVCSTVQLWQKQLPEVADDAQYEACGGRAGQQDAMHGGSFRVGAGHPGDRIIRALPRPSHREDDVSARLTGDDPYAASALLWHSAASCVRELMSSLR